MRAEAFIGGRAASPDEAIAEAARLLGRSRAVVLAGLATDAAGAAAAIALARRVGGTIDHMHADAMLRDLEVMRRAGWVVTTSAQVRARADVMLLVGPGLDDAWPMLWQDLQLDHAPALFPDRRRLVVRLCPGRDAAMPGDGGDSVLSVGEDPADLPFALGVLRAVVGGRAVRSDAVLLPPIRDAATLLASARFGVAVWSAAALDALSIEMLCGLIDDLNAATRFAGLAVPAPGNAAGLTQTMAALGGFPLRIGFADAHPEHDPWRFDATRMIDAGEADLVLWISAFAPEPPRWRRAVSLVALVASATDFPAPPRVEFRVGRPGVDHPAVLFDAALGALVCKRIMATPPGGEAMLSVAEILERIGAALDDAPC